MRTIKISHDISPENPFKSDDGLPSILVNHDRSITEYGTGIAAYITGYPTDNQLTKRASEILETICGSYYTKSAFDYDYPLGEWTKAERADKIREILCDNTDIESLVKMCELFKIPHYSGTSSGYSQGDWADVLAVFTEEDTERTGIPENKKAESCKSAFELFGYWAWGDVYGYRIVETKKCECCGTINEEEIDSCWGFYGDDFQNNGMKDYIPEELWEQLNGIEIS